MCSHDDTVATNAWLDTVDVSFVRRADDILRLHEGIRHHFIGSAHAWPDGFRVVLSINCCAFTRLLVAGLVRKDRLGKRGSDWLGNRADCSGALSTAASGSLSCGYSLSSFARLAACNALDVRCRTKQFGGDYEQTQTTS